MDFIEFKINPTKEAVDVNFGSGLNKVIPSKSPLERNFKFTLQGDCDSPFLSSDEEEK